MPHRFSCNAGWKLYQGDDAKRAVEALGPMPREALAAMVDYGLSDVEISRYFRIGTDTVASLRQYYSKTDDR